MSIPEDTAVEELRMDLDEALGVERASHVIDVGLSRPIESSEVTSSEGVDDPGELELRMVLEEVLVCGGDLVLLEINIRVRI